MPPFIRVITSTASNTLVTIPTSISRSVFDDSRRGLTVTIENRNAGNITIYELVDDLKYRCLHFCRLEIFIGTKVEYFQWFTKQLSLLYIDRNEF